MLRYRDLKTIQEGNRRHGDVMDLLREVRRLRDLVAESYGLMAYSPLNHLSQDQRDSYVSVLDRMKLEPCVQEYRLMKEKKEEMARRQNKPK